MKSYKWNITEKSATERFDHFKGLHFLLQSKGKMFWGKGIIFAAVT